MVEVKQGEIWLYEPPGASTSEQSALLVTSGSEQSGLRPFVIVSRDLVNKGRPTAVGVPLTTKVKKANAFRIQIPQAELLHDVGRDPFLPSVALCDHVRVLDLNQLRTKIGRLSDNALNSVVGLGLAFVFDFR
jgi:mRNA-degrading endonuclease toxin of MazEF toxin-antitoxin module